MGDPADEKRDRVDHERSASALPEDSVHMRFNQNIGWIEFRLDMRADGAKRVKTLGSRELHIALLEVARRNIIQAGIPQNMGKRIVSVTRAKGFDTFCTVGP